VPHSLTIFVATYLVFIEGALAALLLAFILYPRPRSIWVRWAIATGVALVVAFLLAQVGAALYNDPRPFVTDHFHPLIDHAPDNGFPSDHALLAAAIVVAVALARFEASVIFVPFTALVDWARVGSGIHHVQDVVGSSLIVMIGGVVGYFAAPLLTRWVMPYLLRIRPIRRFLESPRKS
jgi:undecaprenyl-diphosphatase